MRTETQVEDRSVPRAITSTAAINGHPLHPMLVPFPIVLLTAALASDIGYLITGDSFWARASLWLVGLGAVAGLLAGAIGAIDFFTIGPVLRSNTARIQAAGNVIAVVLSLTSYLIRLGDPEGAVLWTGLAVSIVVVAILVVTGWLGGELSFRHRVGVIAHGGDER
jgi:uncharacterized membrane protein